MWIPTMNINTRSQVRIFLIGILLLAVTLISGKCFANPWVHDFVTIEQYYATSHVQIKYSVESNGGSANPCVQRDGKELCLKWVPGDGFSESASGQEHYYTTAMACDCFVPPNKYTYTVSEGYCNKYGRNVDLTVESSDKKYGTNAGINCEKQCKISSGRCVDGGSIIDQSIQYDINWIGYDIAGPKEMAKSGACNLQEGKEDLDAWIIALLLTLGITIRKTRAL